MEIIGIVSTVILVLFAFFKITENQQNEEAKLNNKIKLYFHHSPKFSQIREINDGRTLKQKIKEIDNDMEEQKRIKSSIERLDGFNLGREEYNKKKNFLIFENLGFIRQLKSSSISIFSEEEILNKLRSFNPMINYIVKLQELIDNNILEKSKDSYRLGLWEKTVIHPYKLDGNGKPLEELI